MSSNRHGDGRGTTAVTIVTNKSGFDVSLAAGKDGFQDFTTLDAEYIAAASDAVIVAAAKLSSAVEVAESCNRAIVSAQLIDLREKAAELTRTLFPNDHGAEFCRILRSRGAELVTIRWQVNAKGRSPIVIPWNLLWLPHTEEWLGQVAMVRPDRAYQAVGKVSDFDEPIMQVGYAESQLSTRRRAVGHRSPSDRDAVSRLVGRNGHVDPLVTFSAGPLNAAESQLFSRWMSMPRNLFHFSCSATQIGADFGANEVALKADAAANDSHLATHVAPIGSAMLNIRNGTTALHPNAISFAQALRKRGTPAVCSANLVVGEHFGSLFARTLYRLLPANAYNFYQAVRAAQLCLTRRLGHPVALFYQFEGDIDTTVRNGWSGRPRLRLVT